VVVDGGAAPVESGPLFKPGLPRGLRDSGSLALGAGTLDLMVVLPVWRRGSAGG